MSTIFSIRSELSVRSTSQQVHKLSFFELRIGFPGRISMLSGTDECIVLDNAPIIGVLLEVVESFLRLKRGCAAAEVVDFYGEYKLVIRKRGALIECENEFGGGKCEAPEKVFRAAAKEWSDSLLDGIEDQYASIVGNPHYHRVKEQVARAWREYGSAT